MIFLVVLAFFFIFLRGIYRSFFPLPNIDVRGKYVLISGCDSGFGRELAIQLDQKGVHVFAGVFNSSNESSLRSILSQQATVFSLNITQPSDIDHAYDLVREKTNTLHALVNNAGISTSGFIDWMTMESMRQIMDVNFFGHVAMTKKFLPLLISKRGCRVVNICSVAGIITSPMKSAYSASKYALEAFSDCLRREMFPWDLHVSIIEPGPMRTPIIEGHDQAMNRFWNGLSVDVQERWGEDYLRIQTKKISANFLYRHAENPAKVVRDLEHAVLNSAPEIRYRPGWQAKFFFFPLSVLPTWLTDAVLIGVMHDDIQPAGLTKQPIE